MELFEIKNLTFHYPNQERAALKDIDFSVKEGEFLVICGKSGCGKTTLLKHFKTAMSPYGKREGEILLEGRTLEDVSVREQALRIGYVLQSPDNQIVTDKVWHELAFGMENLGYDPGIIRLRVAEMASYFGIQTWFMKKVDELSGGQKQILNLASVMAMQPDLLVLDEPTSQLDPLAAGDFLATIRKINVELGTTILLIEHRLEEVLSYADRVMVMEHGGILALDEPKKLGGKLKGNDMFQAMPVPMRIYDSLEGKGDCPVTVREGHEWLERRVGAEQAEKAKQEKEKRSFAKKAVRKEGSSPILYTREVWFRYEKDTPDVVKDLNMSVQPGELYCLLGGNGTGKTTTLSLLGKLNKPYRGKIFLKGKPMNSYGGELHKDILGILPQNPQCLFVKDTVEEDLLEITGKQRKGFHWIADNLMENTREHASEKEIREKIQRTAELMEITELLKAHPYDLSGGEQQRAALAKILLLDPEILMLDEPTKGMDGFYKKKLADIFQKLKQAGKTILMVSHDVEFCAEYGDTCALFFNGGVVTSAPAREFFCGNSFYTTAANRMARKWYPDVVTAKDVIEKCREK